MKRIMLVRHAKSSWKDDDLKDFDRPLNNRGKSAAPHMAKMMSTILPCPDLMVSSPARRAWDTATVFAKELKYKQDDIFSNTRLYMGSAATLLDVICHLPDQTRFVSMITHNPGLTELINQFSNITTENFPTCAVTVIDFPVESWKHCVNSSGQALIYLCPKLLISQ